MIFAIAMDRWPAPRKSMLVSGPEAEPGKVTKEFFAQKGARKHSCGLPVLMLFDGTARSISIVPAEPEQHQTKKEFKR